MFIGRERELEFLENQFNSPKGRLIFLYGRRRLGKTETLRQFCKQKKHIYFSCSATTDDKQLNAFSTKLLKEIDPVLSPFLDWTQALSSISELPYGNKKKLVIFDEFQNMFSANKEIPSILQNLWDHYLKDQNVMLVFCSSAISYTENDVLAANNPLYGRATGIYKMNELSFYETIKFFPNYSPEDQVLVYSILGGIPHYLIQFDNNLSLEENIKRNILSKGCVLYSEVEFILRQELREPGVYNTIIQTIALGSNNLSEISQKSLINNTSKTSTYLSNLINLGIIQKEFSVDSKTKEQSNNNKGMYSLTDNFFRFWYAFGFTNFSDLEDGLIDDVYNYSIKPSLHNYASVAFENICKQFVKKLRATNKLPFRYKDMGRWLGQTTIRDNNNPSKTRTAETEIDILAISDNKKQYLVGECKFKNKPFQYSEYLTTISKLSPKKNNAEFFYALFSLSGFDERIIEISKEDDHLTLYDINAIVNC